MKFSANIRSQSKRSKWVMYSTATLAILNFSVLWVESFFLGGDALNGYVQAGHYFLCMHGGCTEVSPTVWLYSYWHAITAMGGFFLIFIEAAIFVTTGDIDLDFENHPQQDSPTNKD